MKMLLKKDIILLLGHYVWQLDSLVREFEGLYQLLCLQTLGTPGNKSNMER